MTCFAFYVLVVQGADRQGALYRSFAGEGAEIKTLIGLLFFTGVATLVLRALAVAVQFGAVERQELTPAAGDSQRADQIPVLLQELETAPRAVRHGYLATRLRKLLEIVARTGAADALDSDMQRLAAADRRLAAGNYAMVRGVVTAIAILGVLGVVIGGAAAVAQATAGGAVGAPLDGLNLAFGAASLALATASLLVFARLGLERMETRLLDVVDESVSRQLAGRFERVVAGADPQTTGIHRMCQKVLDAVEAAVSRHDAAITKAITTAGRRWEETASATAALVNRSVGDALSAGLKTHAQSLNDGVARHTSDLEGTLIRHAQILSENIDQHTNSLADALEHHTAVMTQTEQSLAAENRQHLAELEAALGEAMVVSATRQERLIKQSEEMLREMQVSLVEAAGTTVAQQEQLIRQGEVLLKVVEATGQVRKLEDALNSNLASLANSHRFEETVVGLSAALQLLSANLGRPLALRGEIDLDGEEPTSQAA